MRSGCSYGQECARIALPLISFIFKQVCGMLHCFVGIEIASCHCPKFSVRFSIIIFAISILSFNSLSFAKQNVYSTSSICNSDQTPQIVFTIANQASMSLKNYMHSLDFVQPTIGTILRYGQPNFCKKNSVCLRSR